MVSEMIRTAAYTPENVIAVPRSTDIPDEVFDGTRSASADGSRSVARVPFPNQPRTVLMMSTILVVPLSERDEVGAFVVDPVGRSDRPR